MNATRLTGALAQRLRVERSPPNSIRGSGPTALSPLLAPKFESSQQTYKEKIHD
ncbi:MAG TPA: hypothetical protein V6D19_10165 [Stenomitos sp.]